LADWGVIGTILLCLPHLDGETALRSKLLWIAFLCVAPGCGEPTTQSIGEALRADPEIASFQERTGFEIPVLTAERGFVTLGRPFPESRPDPDLLRAVAGGAIDLHNARQVERETERLLRKAEAIAASERGVRLVYWRLVDFEPPNAIGERGGAEVYAEHCERCHGTEGRGDGPEAGGLPVAPTDFVAARFDCRSTAYLTLPEDEDLIGIITEGLPATGMPGTIAMTPGELSSLLEQVKRFSRRWLDEVPGPVVPVTPAPAIDEEFITQGRYAYMVIGCWQCHGIEGRGDGPLLPSLDQPIRPFGAEGFLCGASLEKVHRTLITGTASRWMPPVEDADLTFIRDSLEERLMGHRQHLDTDAFPLDSAYSEQEIEQLREYITTLPVWRQIDIMPAEELAVRVAWRRWALAAYVVRELGGLSGEED